jgi:3-oxoadipate enol-lactonase
VFARQGTEGDRTTPQDRMIDLPGRGRIHVRVATGPKRAPTLVLLHGLGATAALNWDAIIPMLASRFHVVAPDLRGHGRGLRCGGRFRLEDCADDVAALIEAITGGRPVLVAGYSMGGPVTQLLCHRHPDLVAGMILCATARDFRGSPAERLQFSLLASLATASRLTPVWWPSVLPSALREKRVLPGVLDEIGGHETRAVLAAAASLGTFTSRAWIEDLCAPAVVVATMHDRLVPVRRQEKLAASLRAPIVEVDGNHFVAHRNPKAFGAAILQAIDLLPRRARKARSRTAATKAAA